MSLARLCAALPGNVPIRDVLLVEDNPGDRRLLEELLHDASDAAEQKTAVELVCADRLADAREFVRTNAVDLVLLDLSLPDSAGLETLRSVRAAAPDVPIIVLTGLSDDDAGVEALHAGALDYVVKGEVTAPLLVRAIRHATARRALQATLQRQALVDELTGLHNRRAFEALAEEQLRLAHRMRHAVLLLAVDLDGLKPINDDHGHAAGDEAIRAAAHVLQASLRHSDIVARTGGDEFLALAIDVNAEAERTIRARIEDHCARVNVERRQSGAHVLGMSVGAVHVRIEGATQPELADLCREADRRLYEDKRGRRGRLTGTRG